MSEKDSTNTKGIKLSDAVKVVREAIDKKIEQLQEIATAEEQDLVLVEGETYEGYPCHLLVDPKDVAKIFLEYDYPTWNIIEDDAPTEMWAALARKFGVKSVSSVDL